MGNDTRNAIEAWQVYDTWLTDPRVRFSQEDPAFDLKWRNAGPMISGGANAWTDAYISAFAAHIGATVVTFDRKFPLLENTAIKTLF